MRKILTLLTLLLLGMPGNVNAIAADYFPEIINTSSYNKMLGYLLIAPRDVRLYERIFEEIEAGKFTKADKLEKKLENNILLGNVLAEKYLHRDYKTSFEELKEWLQNYADHPQASRIYRLARRKDKKQALTLPSKDFEPPLIYGWDNKDIEKLKEADKHYLQREVGKFRRYINQGKTKRARLVLEQKKFRMLAPDKYWDDMAATLAQKYFVDNYDRLAWQWSTRAARRRTSGTAAWIAGLSAWRMKDYKNAALYFSRLGKSSNSDKWLVSAGGYWAYRAYTRLGNKNKAREMLKHAAGYKHTFYGILAAHKLGQPLDYNWETIPYLNDFQTNDYVYELLASPAIRRAVILIHAGQKKLAEQELRHGYNAMNDKQKEAVIFMANQYQMHSLAIYAVNQNRKSAPQNNYDSVAYPIPGWFPKSGWKVDKALVLGMVRQESAFRPDAKSPAGAHGLMQLMPNTAYHITKDISIKRDKSRLLRADYNLELGQKYIEYLLGKPYIEGNLFYMMTAYNAGPGNLVKWQKNSRYQDDPLLFIEAIPSAETRIYIERVTANYWIYNIRFDLSNQTLKQVASGQWPVLKGR